jgi:hypothetical protein
MATLLATQNGNIDDPSTWGETIPTSIDILDAREYIVNINTNSSYNKLINTLGGYFLLSDGIRLSAEIENTQTLGLSGYCVLYEGTSSSSITGKVKGGSGSLNYYGVYINNNNHLIVNGSVVGGFKLNSNIGGGIGIKSSVNAQGSLLVNGDIGLEGTGTFFNPTTATTVSRAEFAAINSEALSSIQINGDIFLPGSNNASIVNSVEGLQGLIVKNSSNSPINPTVKVNGDIIINDNHGYGNTYQNGIDYRGNTDALTIPGLIEINGNINVTTNTYYNGIRTGGKVNINLTGDIIGGTQNSYGLRIINNNNSTITLSNNMGFTGNTTGTNASWFPVYITNSNNMSINVLGDIKNQFIRLGDDGTGGPVVNCTLNIEGNILNEGGFGCVYTSVYCNNNIVNIVGDIYGGNISQPPVNIRLTNLTNNVSLNVFASKIIGGNIASAIVSDVNSTATNNGSIHFNINAEEIAANPAGGNGHAISVPNRYLGTFKINAKRILDNFAGVTALYVRSYDLSDVPNDAIIRYAAAPFAGFGPYVIHSTINSLSTFQMPPPEAVREGVVYANGSLTGACRIPSVSSVLLGTPVGAPDGNVGIATLDESLLNYDAIYNAPLTAFNYPNSVGEKLRAGPTTEIVGELIESFFPVH